MQLFAIQVVAEEHKSVFDWTVAIRGIWTVHCLSLTVNVRVEELDGDFIAIAFCLEVDTHLVIDTRNIVHAHL